MQTQVNAREEAKVGVGASTLVLLALVLLSLTGSVDTANWADGLGILSWAAMGGLLLGVLLARSRLRSGLAHLISVVLGVPAVIALSTFLLPALLSFEVKLILLEERTRAWFIQALSGGTGSDNLLFVVQLAFVTWFMAYTAAWFIYRRHQVWGAIVPAGAAILFNLFYAAPQTGLYFIIFVLSSLLLVVRVNLSSMERWWRRASIGYAADVGIDVMSYGTLFTLLLMAFAWLLPATAPGPSWLDILDPLESPWQNVEDQFNRVFSSLRAVGRAPASTFFGTTLVMGGPVHLGNRPVMDIQTNTGGYWTAAVYDMYTGSGWINTHVATKNLPADDPSLYPFPDQLRVEVTQTIKVFLPDQNILFAESEPMTFSLPTEVRYGQPPASESNTKLFDVALVRSRRPLREGDTYVVQSAVSAADEQSLRSAPTTYPAWIVRTYLQLPLTVPKRVRDLALQITKPYNNPYDKAVAIQDYLRTHINYNENVSPPPPGRDGVDYTLFDRPEGYCNYYASAMAVLAREVGIPSRVASGYAMGTYQDGVYHIVEANAHSWPELYFPNYGWIEFEPTASQPEIARPNKAQVVPEGSDQQLSDVKSPVRTSLRGDGADPGIGLGTGGLNSFGASFLRDPRNAALAGGGFLFLVGLGMFGAMQWKRFRRSARLAPGARVYQALLSRAGWLGVQEHKDATPLERARVIGDALPQARNEIELSAVLYARETYGGRSLGEAERSALSAASARVNAAWRRGMIVYVIARLLARPRAVALRIHQSLRVFSRRAERF